jgi:hypothetical protein
VTATGLQLVQGAAVNEPADLFVWSLGDLQADLRQGAPGDTIVYYFNGAGTSSYEHPPTIAQIAAKYPAPGNEPYRHVSVSGWSAGGRAVQRWLDNGAVGVDAVLLADALYTGLVRGKADPKPLTSAINYAIKAATSPENAGPIFVFWHSSITPPGYASSGQCADAVRAAVEKAVGPMEEFTPPDAFRATLTSAVRLGNCILLGYKGADAAEHVREAHLIDDAMRAFVPWCSPDCGIIDGVVCYEPEIDATVVVDVVADNAPAEPPTQAAPISVVVCTLRPGDHGSEVVAWQERLNAPAFDGKYSCGKVDGSYGTNTTRATRAFQADHSVGADGCVDKSTRTAMAKVELELARAITETNAAGTQLVSLGKRALAKAILEIGQHEIPGVEQNPRVRAYLRGARRNGQAIGDSEDIAWCAAFVGWCNTQAMDPGEKIPPWRVSVAEIWQDALRLGTGKSTIYMPQPGDLVLFKRNGQDPRNGGEGHVGRVETAPDVDGRFFTIGGNEGGTLHNGGEVMRTLRRVTDTAIAGYVT